MKTFNETLHPRGQVGNAGQFRERADHVPAGGLAAPLAERLDQLREHYATLLGQAEEAEAATWLAFVLEDQAPGSHTVHLDFEVEQFEGGESHHVVSCLDSTVDRDQLVTVIPEWMGDGDGEVSFRDGVYQAWLSDDAGQSKSFTADLGGRVSRERAEELAQEVTEHRATLRDTVEQLALVDAFERATELSGADSATFRPAAIDGMVTLHCLESGFHVAAGDQWQADAFRFAGQNISEVRVTRTPDGYRIERLVTAPVSGKLQTLTTDVDGEPKRWGTSTL